MGEPVTEIREDRDLSEKERALVTWLIMRGAPSAASYLSQVPEVRVVSRCACGCASLNFDIGGKGWRSPGGMQFLSEYEWQDVEGRFFGIMLFAKADTLAGIDVYSLDGLAVPRELPQEDLLK